jgi:hypothetical protein
MTDALKLLINKLSLIPKQLLMSPDTPNVMQTMMQLEQAKTRAKSTNNVAVEAEKEKDTAEKAVDELTR